MQRQVEQVLQLPVVRDLSMLFCPDQYTSCSFRTVHSNAECSAAGSVRVGQFGIPAFQAHLKAQSPKIRTMHSLPEQSAIKFHLRFVLLMLLMILRLFGTEYW